MIYTRTCAPKSSLWTLSILDEAFRCVWVYPMKCKNEASKLIKEFCAVVQTQFSTKVKTNRSDNGSEFVSIPMKQFYKEHGIIHETSCVDTPQQNGRIERKHHHVLNVARALRFKLIYPLNFGENVC